MLKKRLAALMREIIAEADANPDFHARLEVALGQQQRAPVQPKARDRDSQPPHPKRPGNRRAPALLDPVQLAREGDQNLRDALNRLDLEQLRDVVADYGMDPSKLVMKWRDKERVIDRIFEIARGRAHKGSAFTGSASSSEVGEAPSVSKKGQSKD